MLRFWALIKKEYLHIIRDKRSLIILIGIPIIQILLFGFAITNEIKEAKIAILDHSKDKTTRQITNKILSGNYYSLYDNLKSEKQIEGIFKKGLVKLVIIFESDFEKKLTSDGIANVQIIADATEPNIANTLLNYTSGIIQSFSNELNSNVTIPFRIIPEIRMMYNPELKGVYLFVPGLIALILILVSALMTSISLTKEKELGSMEILLVSPLPPWQVIIAKVIPYSVLACINAISILLLGKFVFGVPIVGDLFLLSVVIIIYLITSLALGILISTKAPSQQVALFVSFVGLMMPTILLSGFIFPVENMPLLLQIIAGINPSRWFLIILRDIMLKGAGFVNLWKEITVLSGFAVFFILLSIKNYKIRL